MEWEQVVQEMAANPSFASEVKATIDRFNTMSTEKLSTMFPSSFAVQTFVGYTVEHRFAFYKLGLFEDHFKAKPGEPGMVVDKIHDHAGNEIQGVLVSSQDESKPLEVTAFYRSDCLQTDHLQSPHGQLRAKQTEEYARAYLADIAKLRPRGFQRPSAVPTASEILDKKKALDEAKKRREEEAEVAAKSLATLGLPEGDENPDEEESEEEEPESEDEVVDEVERLSAMVLPSAKAAVAKKGKGKGKGRQHGLASSKARPKPKAKGRMTLGVKRFGAGEPKSSRDGEEGDASTVSAKPGSALGSNASFTEKNDKVQEYVDEICLSVALDGHKKIYGRELWQAQQTLQAMSTDGKPVSAAACLLATHIEMAYLARDQGA